MPDSQEIQSRQSSDGYIELDPPQAEVTRVAKHLSSTPGLLIQVCLYRKITNFQLRKPLVISSAPVNMEKSTKSLRFKHAEQ